MKKQKQFTTTLSIDCIADLDAAARETGRRRNDILQAHVIATARPDEGLVGIVEVEVPRELVRRRLAIEPGIPALLLLGQETDGHDTSLAKLVSSAGIFQFLRTRALVDLRKLRSKVHSCATSFAGFSTL